MILLYDFKVLNYNFETVSVTIHAPKWWWDTALKYKMVKINTLLPPHIPKSEELSYHAIIKNPKEILSSKIAKLSEETRSKEEWRDFILWLKLNCRAAFQE